MKNLLVSCILPYILLSPALSAPFWVEDTIFTPNTVGSLGQSTQSFVAINGSTVLVGGEGKSQLIDLEKNVLTHELNSTDGHSHYATGWSVALNSNRALMGAWANSFNEHHSGAAYLFSSETGNGIRRLTQSDPDFSDNFGISVALNETYAIIGSRWDDDNGLNTGAAYVYNLSNGSQKDKLKANNGSSWDEFGWLVAANESYTVIGTKSGKFYLFDLSSGSQIRQFALPDSISNFIGSSLAISDTHVIIGLPRNNDDGVDSGKAYLFRIASGELDHELSSDDVNLGDHFGASVAINAGYAVVGAPNNNDFGENSGSVYLFDINTGEQVQKIIPSNGFQNKLFGRSIGISNSNIVVADTNSVYSFTQGERDESLASPVDISLSRDYINESSPIGAAVATLSPIIQNNLHYSLVTGEGDADNSYFNIFEGQLLTAKDFDFEVKNLYSIRIRVTNRNNDQYEKIFAINILDDRDEDFDQDGLTEAEEEDIYGSSDIDTDSDDDGFLDNIEADQNTSLTDANSKPIDFVTNLKVNPNVSIDEEGAIRSVSISNSYAAVSSNYEKWDDLSLESEYLGYAYLFDSSTGAQLFTLEPIIGDRGQGYGQSIAVSEKYAVVGAYGNNEEGRTDTIAYVYNPSTGEQLHRLTNPHTENQISSLQDPTDLPYIFDSEVVIRDEIAIVSVNHHGYMSAIKETHVLVYDLNSGEYLRELMHPDGNVEFNENTERSSIKGFGESIAISNGMVAVSAPYEDVTAYNTGAVYFFDLENGNLIHKLAPTSFDSHSNFGRSLSIHDNTLIVTGGGKTHLYNTDDWSFRGSFDGSSSVAISENYFLLGLIIYDRITGNPLKNLSLNRLISSNASYGNKIILGYSGVDQSKVCFNIFDVNINTKNNDGFMEAITNNDLQFIGESPESDPLSRGIQNGLSYALNIPLSGEVTATQRTRLPKLVNGHTANTAGLGVSIPENAPEDATYCVMASENLGDWTEIARKVGNGNWTGDAVVHETTSNGMTEVVIENTKDMPQAPKAFMRLEVEISE